MIRFISLTWIAALVLGLSGCATTTMRQPASELVSGRATEVFRLRSGKKILLPRRTESLDYVFLQGRGDLTVLNQMLAAEDLLAIPGSDGQGQIGVIISRYNASSLGAYQEVMVVIGAQPKAIKDSSPVAGNIALPEEGLAPPTPYYVWQTAVDSQLALDAGREVWGMPGTLGAIDLQAGKNADWTFRYGTKPKGLVFEGKCGNCGLAAKQRLGAVFTLISGYGVRRSLVHVENLGMTLLRPYDVGIDAFNMKPNSAVAELLKRVGFRPTGWFVGEGLSAVASK